MHQHACATHAVAEVWIDRAEIEAMRGVHRELMKKFKIEEAKANAPEIDWAYYAERVKSSDV
eukprot:3734084-Rhodomonas_salina.1